MLGEFTEKSSISRLLLISKEACSAFLEDKLEDPRGIFEMISAALSHADDEKEPLRRIFPALKKGFKEKDRAFYSKISLYFKKRYAAPEIKLDFAVRHIPAVIGANDKICEKIAIGDTERAKTMAQAAKSLPGYIFGEFPKLSSEKFYELVFGFYPKLYGEDFMEKFKGIFCGEIEID